jgi:hypothetical protein
VNPARSSGAVASHTIGALIASGLLLAGCGTPRFERAPQPVVDLSGQWVLEPAASDDAAKMIAEITPKPRPWTDKDRRAQAAADAAAQSTGQGGGQGGQGGQGNRGSRRGGHGEDQGTAAPRVSDTLPAWGRVRPGDFISAFAMPPPAITIEQRPASVRIGIGEARRREFQPGDEAPFSVTDRYGSRKVSAGWRRDEFLIHSADGSRLTVVEHYRRRADDRLETVVEFSAQGLKSLNVHSVYRRATSAELQAPSEGPPAPAPR